MNFVIPSQGGYWMMGHFGAQPFYYAKHSHWKTVAGALTTVSAELAVLLGNMVQLEVERGGKTEQQYLDLLHKHLCEGGAWI